MQSHADANRAITPFSAPFISENRCFPSDIDCDDNIDYDDDLIHGYYKLRGNFDDQVWVRSDNISICIANQYERTHFFVYRSYCRFAVMVSDCLQ